MDSSGRIFVADTWNSLIRRIDTTTTLQNLAGSARASDERFPLLYAAAVLQDGPRERGEDALRDRDYARAWLPHSIDGGAQAEVPIEVPAPAEPGRYQLKFDLVSEGIDWFEACGSETTTKLLRVW